MEVVYGINKIKQYRKPVVALGVFDGVHLAHRRILKEAARAARRIKGTSIAVTFWPHPQKKASLYSLAHRLRLIGKLGINACIVIKFTKTFSRIYAEDFIKNILINGIGAQYIYVGRNFRYGRFAKGDYKLLKKYSHIYNFKLKAFDVIKINHQPISSTYIRRLIRKGNLKRARAMLSNPVTVLGTVIRGSSFGRQLGFPTANINPHHEVLPPCGVYAVKIIYNNKILKGLCYIGTQPTFKTKKSRKAKLNVEAYILNFNKNIYGKYLEIQFIAKLRNEMKFVSAASLAKQIKKDICRAKALHL